MTLKILLHFRGSEDRFVMEKHRQESITKDAVSGDHKINMRSECQWDFKCKPWVCKERFYTRHRDDVNTIAAVHMILAVYK